MLKWLNENWFKIVIAIFLGAVAYFLIHTAQHGLRVCIPYKGEYFNNFSCGF